ncbi:MAG: ATP-binding protein [Chloroflexota bacterium]
MSKQQISERHWRMLQSVSQQSQRLAIFGGVLADETGQTFLRLLDTMARAGESNTPDLEEIASSYTRLFVLLAAEAELYPQPLIGDAWQNHLLDRLLLHESVLSRKAQVAGPEDVGPSLLHLAGAELWLLQALHSFDSHRLCTTIREILHELDGGESPEWLVPWDELRPLKSGPAPLGAAGVELKRELHDESDWTSLAGRLAAYYAQAGSGEFARFRAFRWLHDGQDAHLAGIPVPDPIRLIDLIAYEPERALLLQNTEQFLAGYPANNVLLYGDRGTGKSSTVKALLNEYAERGLRLIEVPRQYLPDYPEITELVRGRRERFILFVDDLSFDEHETEYRELKAALEGSLEARPDNLLIYATSNRRHLVQERFSDRQAATSEDEIHGQDTAQEKLSLSDRFGITLTFLAPDQERFLRIVEGLAQQRGLPLESDELRSRALRWAARHTGRSGRAARQFIDFLTGEIGLGGF